MSTRLPSLTHLLLSTHFHPLTTPILSHSLHTTSTRSRNLLFTFLPTLPLSSTPTFLTPSTLQSLTVPTKLPCHAVPNHAHGTWLLHPPSPSSSPSPPSLLNVPYLRSHHSNLHLPTELSNPSTSLFHRAESVPLSFFLDAWQQTSTSTPDSPRLYIAQAPLSLLPKDLADAFPVPKVVSEGDGYGSSLWLGKAPTDTPLHRDPNLNLFVQVAGRKRVRLVCPEKGGEVWKGVRRGKEGGGGFGRDERVRGEEMMKGEERRVLEEVVWGEEGMGNGNGNGDGDGDGWEADLEEGEALVIPTGWWHAVRGIGEGVNLSVNWWFRPRV